MPMPAIRYSAIILFLLFTFSATGQRLYFSDTSNKWTFLCASDAGSPPPPDLYLNGFHYETYETINGITYSRFQSGELVRDDTATGKVMIYVNDSTESVLYDWSLHVGDTIISITQSMTYYSILDSVDTFYYNNVPLVKQMFNVERLDGLGAFSYVAWEGIGCDWDPFYTLCPCALEPLCGLCSFKNSDTQSIYFNGLLCTLTVNDKSKNISAVTIFPSPAHDELIIMSSIIDDKAIISLVDITGKELMQQQGLEINKKLQLADIPSGIYFIRILPNTIRETHKVVIE